MIFNVECFVTGHYWLHDDKMLVGADNGDLLLFDNAGRMLHGLFKALRHVRINTG